MCVSYFTASTRTRSAQVAPSTSSTLPSFGGRAAVTLRLMTSSDVPDTWLSLQWSENPGSAREHEPDRRQDGEHREVDRRHRDRPRVGVAVVAVPDVKRD